VNDIMRSMNNYLPNIQRIELTFTDLCKNSFHDRYEECVEVLFLQIQLELLRDFSLHGH